MIPTWFKRFGKYALIAYIAYNLIELAIVIIWFPDVFTNILSKAGL